MPNILAGRRVQLLFNQIRDMLSSAIEQISHSRILRLRVALPW
jgi:hypothetical protein